MTDSVSVIEDQNEFVLESPNRYLLVQKLKIETPECEKSVQIKKKHRSDINGVRHSGVSLLLTLNRFDILF